jgi:hypothetical protein
MILMIKKQQKLTVVKLTFKFPIFWAKTIPMQPKKEAPAMGNCTS